MNVLLVLALLLAAGFAEAAAWPTFGFDAARSGTSSGEHRLSGVNVARLHERWQIDLGAVADSAPIVAANVLTPHGRGAMLYLTTSDGVTLAVDPRSGRVVWRFDTHGPKITTSVPVIGPAGRTLYVPGVDGFVHALDAANGREQRARGFPVRITTMPETEKNASALNLAGGYLYAVTSGYYGDAPPYDGHLVAVRLRDGATNVFNSLCSNERTLPTATSCPSQLSGIWARAGAVVDPDPAMHGRVYVATGNGNFDANRAGHDYGDSLLALSADGAHLLGSYTPRDYAALEAGDTDLGSTTPALLPRQAHSRTPLLAVQGGKDGILRLLDRAHLPGVGGELQELDLGTALFSTPAVWSDAHGVAWVFLGLPSELRAFRLVRSAGGDEGLVQAWSAPLAGSTREGTSPVVAGGLVFTATSGALQAFDAESGRERWSSANPGAGRSIGTVHWQSPVVADGWLYCADGEGRLTAYSL
ncbi:MAG: PQQ-binding-like beta-propeller repeat protein [Vulcanimicrobiaceae bacterium]